MYSISTFLLLSNDYIYFWLFQVCNLHVRCLLCCSVIHTVNTQNIRRHIATDLHTKAIELRDSPKPPNEASWQACTDRQNPFYKELTEFFLKTDIPIDKLNDPAFVSFMQRYIRRPLPDSRTLRRGYVSKVHEETIVKIRNEIGDNPIYISIDETIDSEKRCVFNAIVSPLIENHPSAPLLLNVEFSDTSNAEKVVQFFNRSLAILWPGGIRHDKVLLFVSDAAPYMKLAGRTLANAYPKMIHVTCLAHGLHRIAETVRQCFPEVNEIISGTKAIFTKAPNRVRLFKEMCNDIPFPPSPIITRWGTWINAASYYHEHYEHVKRVILALQPDSQNIIDMQQHFQRDQNQQDLTEIHNNYSIIAEAIQKLETQGLPLNKSCKIVRRTIRHLLLNVNIRQDVRLKAAHVIQDNTDFFEILTTANQCLQKNDYRPQNLPYRWTEQDVRRMKYAPITSVDVERSFSQYKSILRSNRQSFLEKNLFKYVIVRVNKTV